MYNILICDDEKDIVSALSIYLSTENYNIFTAYTGQEALDIVAKHDIHLILMDIMMPQMDGIAATVKLRETSNIPIILLTAKSEDSDKILGLNIGADDYITKPFNPIEVLARVRSQLRRYTSLGGMAKKASHLTNGGIEMDDESKIVTVDGEVVSLTPSEYNILKLLMENPGQSFFLPRKSMNASGMRMPAAPAGVVAVHIRHLREKLRLTPRTPVISR